MLPSNSFAENNSSSRSPGPARHPSGLTLAAQVLTREKERHVGNIVIPEPEADKAGHPDDWKNEYGQTHDVVKRQWTYRQGAHTLCSGLDGA